MFVVLFEVQPKREQWDRYLELAAMLRPELLQIRGFIDNERYSSEHIEGRLLSLSTWEDEKALVRWRTQARHHDVQRQGRFEVFEDTTCASERFSVTATVRVFLPVVST